MPLSGCGPGPEEKQWLISANVTKQWIESDGAISSRQAQRASQMARPSMAFKVLNMIEGGRSVGRRQLDHENH